MQHFSSYIKSAGDILTEFGMEGYRAHCLQGSALGCYSSIHGDAFLKI